MDSVGNLQSGARLLNRRQETSFIARRILALTLGSRDARFPAAKWFTHRTSLTRFAALGALRGWRRCAATQGEERSISPPIGILGQPVRDYSLNPEERFTQFTNVGIDRFGKADDLQPGSVLQSCGGVSLALELEVLAGTLLCTAHSAGRGRRQIGDWLF